MRMQAMSIDFLFWGGFRTITSQGNLWENVVIWKHAMDIIVLRVSLMIKENFIMNWLLDTHTHCAKKINTIHQVTTMLATSKMSYFQVITTCYPPVLMTQHFENRLFFFWVPPNQSVRSSVPVSVRAHSFFALPNPFSCSIMNKICLNQCHQHPTM